MKTFCWLAWLLGATAVAAGPTGTLIVLNKSDHTATLIDAASGKVVATVPTGLEPHEVVVSPDGKIAVVANYGTGQKPGNTLSVIDLPGKAKLKDISLGENRRPHGVAWLRDSLVAVTTEESKKLLVVDIDRDCVVAGIDTDQNISHMVALTPDRSRAFVANIGSGSVSVIDLAKNERIVNIETGAGAEGIDVSPDGREVWVTNRSADTLTVIDAASLKVLATLECRAFPIRTKFTPDGRHVLVSNARSGDVAVFDAKTRKEVQRIKMEFSPVIDADRRLFGTQFGTSPVPVGILIAPSGQFAYVANTQADVVTVIDLATWKIVERIVAGKEPDGLALSKLILSE
jgi:YVTN family beta-propeller protein